VPVSSLVDVYAIAAGGDHGMALLYDGTVWTWGRDGFGQLGNGGGSLNIQSPAPVPGLSDAYMIAAGGDHSLALRYDGTVWAWGADGSGQLGDGGSGVNQQNPVQVINLFDVQTIAAGNAHSLSLRYDLSLWVWGSDTQGQLGNGLPLSSRREPCGWVRNQLRMRTRHGGWRPRLIRPRSSAAEDIERDHAAELGIVRLVHDAHAARAELAQDDVAPELLEAADVARLLSDVPRAP
jgi:hypothetical protein